MKYTQLFNATDKNRNGFLSGTQARGILIQSKLPQQILAQIWALSDMDSDGRLGCEEFVLAMYLCDQAIQGEKIPTVIPPDLIPPSFRKASSRHGSVQGSRHGSVSSQGTPSHTMDLDAMAGLPQSELVNFLSVTLNFSLYLLNFLTKSQFFKILHKKIISASFEDKRKENFDKGQAELERRRKVLADIQRKEQDERERKERDEADKREKARLEAEMKKQQEIERELQRQREIEEEKEEQRKRELERKEQARK